MKANPICRVCGIVLDSENWYPSHKKGNVRICKNCESKRQRLWRNANPEKQRAIQTRANNKRGHQSFNENKNCTMFLGVHIAERVLSNVFKDVERMPMHNPGYDVICNRDKRIDIKSSCTRKDKRWGGVSWTFKINHNTTADFFLCLAFDNREDLTPLHAWLIPGSKLNHLASTSISPSTIHKWDVYRMDISKISDCCDKMRL